jgi:hypothetical protein
MREERGKVGDTRPCCQEGHQVIFHGYRYLPGDPDRLDLTGVAAGVDRLQTKRKGG